VPAGTLNLGNLQAHILADNSQFAKVMRNTTATLDAVSMKMTSIGKKMTTRLTLPLTGIATASLVSFAKFDDAMTQSLAIMGDVSDQMRMKMEATAKAISTESITAPQELAKAYFFLASAGMTAAQSEAALATVEKFAVAGRFDMAMATDLLTDAQSALGLSSKDAEKNMQGLLKVSDTLVKANTLANATVQQFSEALTNNAGPAIKQYNIDLEEGVAILAAYADQGLKGQEAGSMFGRMTRLLIKSINDNSQAFSDLNINVEEFAATGKNLTGVLDGISKATEGMGPAQKAATLEMLGFQARTQQAILPLLGITDRIRDYEAELKKAGGTTKDIADKQLTSFSSQMKIVWNNIVVVGQEIGNVLEPAVRSLGKWIKDVTMWFRGLSDTSKRAIIFFGVFAAAIGPVLLSLGSMALVTKIAIMTTVTFLGVIGKVFAVIKSISAALAVATGGLSSFLIPIAAVGLAIWVIVDAFTAADLGILEFFRSIKIGGKSLGVYWDALGTYIWQTWDWVVNKLKLMWETFWFTVKEIGNKMDRAMLRVAKGISDSFWWVIKKVTFGFTNMIRSTVDNLNDVGLITNKTRAKMIKSATKADDKIRTSAAESTAHYERLIKKSLDNSGKEWDKYTKKVIKLDEEHTKNAEKWAKVRSDIFKKETAPKFLGPVMAPAFEVGLSDIFDIQTMIEQSTPAVTSFTETVTNSTKAMASQFQEATPVFQRFAQEAIGSLFDVVSDPEIQALGAVSAQLAGIYQNRLQIVRDYGEEHQRIMEDIANSSLGIMQKEAARHEEIQRHKNAVLLTGVAGLFAATLSLITNGGKKNFIMYKRLAQAQAAISAFAAYNNALATPGVPPGVAQVLAASMLALGLAKVHQIERMKPGGGIGGGGGGAISNFGITSPAGGIAEPTREEEREKEPDRYTIIIENINGSADEDFADKLAESLLNRSKDGRDFGFATTSQ
jgi:TP901 family phage tail tape measure protein